MGTTAQQPNLRSFIVYDHLPAGCFAFEIVNCDNRDHLRPGDFAVIDESDTEPHDGELFLIEWSSGPEDSRLQIVETEQHRGRIADPEKWPGNHWMVSRTRPHRMVNLAETVVMEMRFKDGPWPTAALTDKLRGKVVGIYQPDFRNLFGRLSA